VRGRGGGVIESCRKLEASDSSEGFMRDEETVLGEDVSIGSFELLIAGIGVVFNARRRV
jgi:hypothetical protein